jgi:hypothetical protein
MKMNRFTPPLMLTVLVAFLSPMPLKSMNSAYIASQINAETSASQTSKPQQITTAAAATPLSERLTQLAAILNTDNLPGLKGFIGFYSDFDWTKAYSNSSFPQITTRSPSFPLLFIAISYKAVNCLNHLLKNNIGGIQSTINSSIDYKLQTIDQYTTMISFNPFDYANAVLKSSQNANNTAGITAAKSIQSILKRHGAKTYEQQRQQLQ